MGFDAQDKELVRLLTKLKNTDGKYPPDLLTARRQVYLKQMGEVGMGIGAGIKIKNALNGAKTPALSSATSTVLESALVAAIVAETGTVAYFYRDKLADVFETISKEVKNEEVTPLPTPSEAAVQGIAPSQAIASLLPSATLSTTPTEIVPSSTPGPELVDDTTVADSTPAPNINEGNNGNHYGQTPKPDRTKEPKENGDKTPKDQSPNDKPPKKN